MTANSQADAASRHGLIQALALMTKSFPFAMLLSSALVASCSSTPLSRMNPSCGDYTGIPDSRLLLFGELHGTNEAPALVGQHVCLLAKEGREVVIGLEIYGEEQERLNEYLRTLGKPSDRLKLLAGRFWQKPRQDGRSSTAMLSLIERIRAIKVAGGNVRIVAIDQTRSGITRDAAMAAAIRDELPTSEEGRVVVLIGNYHATKAPRVESSTAFLISDLAPTTVVIGYRSGTAWVCDMSGICGIESLSSSWAPGRPLGFQSGAAPLPGYDGTYLLEAITASPPAKQLSQ